MTFITDIKVFIDPGEQTMLTATIPAYAYAQYADDDSIQAFFSAYNTMAQQYVSWFSGLDLPIYTKQSGGLLDWVGQGIYGIERPSLASGSNRYLGPPNTLWPNHPVFVPNKFKAVGPQNVVVTSDDIYKRIMTWNLSRIDDPQEPISIPWIKQRVMRFLYGVDGANVIPDNSYQISVVVGLGVIAIALTSPLPPEASIFKEAMDSGFLQMPFQYTVSVSIT
jgi:hypothetical protein